MVQITQDDVRKIARLSHINIHDDELEMMTRQLQAVLSYASRVQEIAQDVSFGQGKLNHNVVRPDVVVKTDSDPIMAAAPEREGNYFVVPVIVEAGQ